MFVFIKVSSAKIRWTHRYCIAAFSYLYFEGKKVHSVNSLDWSPSCLPLIQLEFFRCQHASLAIGSINSAAHLSSKTNYFSVTELVYVLKLIFWTFFVSSFSIIIEDFFCASGFLLWIFFISIWVINRPDLTLMHSY